MIAFETEALRDDILLCEGPSQVTYHEYATFAKPRARQTDPAAAETTGSTGSPLTQVTQSMLSADGSGDELFGLALRRGYGLDRQVISHPLVAWFITELTLILYHEGRVQTFGRPC